MDDTTNRTRTLCLTSEKEEAVPEQMKEVEASRKQASLVQSGESASDENTLQYDSHGDTTHGGEDCINHEDDEYLSKDCLDSEVDADNGANISSRQALHLTESSPDWDEHVLSQALPSTQVTSWDFDRSGNPYIYPQVDDIDRPVPELKEAERLQNPFRELHYFYHYIVTTSERICLEFARGHPLWDLDSPNFLRSRLYDPENPRGFYSLADKDWNEPGQIEMSYWYFFFRKLACICCSHEQSMTVFKHLDRVRQAAVHRQHSLVDREVLEAAMVLPRLMRNREKDDEMTRVYSILRKDDGYRSPEDQEFFNKCVYTQENRPISIHEFLAQLQYLCETSAFEYARTADPEFLTSWHADCPEHIELRRYYDHWSTPSSSVKPHPSYLETHPDTYDTESRWCQTLDGMRQLRNDATHRSLCTEPAYTARKALEQRVQWASTFVAMMGEKEMVARVERIGKQWLDEYGPVAEDEEWGT